MGDCVPEPSGTCVLLMSLTGTTATIRVGAKPSQDQAEALTLETGKLRPRGAVPRPSSHQESEKMG